MIKEDWAINTLVVYSVCVMDDDGELPVGDVRLSAVDVRRILTKKDAIRLAREMRKAGNAVRVVETKTTHTVVDEDEEPT